MYIVVDVGGTKTRIAGSSDLQDFSEPVILQTPSTYEEGIKMLTERAQTIAGTNPIQGIALGVAGSLSADKRSLARSRHLEAWENQLLAETIEKTLNTKAYVENDTALVGLGEASHGAGAGVSILAYITVSTGVNGVRIVDGNIDRAAQGFEIGGQYLLVGEHMETFEDLVSGSAIQKRTGKHPRDLGKDSPEWEDLAKLTAVGVHNAIVHWSPDKVVLGGSMFNEIGISVPSVQEHVKTLLKKFAVVPEIVHASLGDIGGLWGGLALLKQRVDV